MNLLSILDPLSQYISSSFNDKHLCHFALVCKATKRFCTSEINKRTLLNIGFFQAAVALNKAIDLSLAEIPCSVSKIENMRTEMREEVKRIEKMLEHFSTIPFSFFVYLSSITLPSPLSKIFKKQIESLKILKNHYNLNEFYMRFDCKQEIRPYCNDLLERFELSIKQSIYFTHPDIYVNTNKKTLSGGNFAVFFIANKQLEGAQQSFPHLDSMGGMIYYNNKGHKKIILLADETSPEENDTFLLCHQLQAQVGLLTELRLLEIFLPGVDYTPRLRACFLSLLKGARKLFKLKCLYCDFKHKISDVHTRDLNKHIQYLTDVKHSLNRICICCEDISLEQLKSIVDNLKLSLATPLTLEVIIPRSCQHLTSFQENKQRMSTPRLTVKIKIRDLTTPIESIFRL